MRLSLDKIVIPLCIVSMSVAIHAESIQDNTDISILKKMEACRVYKSEFERLDCYDNAWGNMNPSIGANKKLQGGKAWNRAMNQESERNEDSIKLLTRISGSETNPTVIITTPSLGHKPPRPVLMFSCIDNITRLQIALPQPIEERDVHLDVITDKVTFKTHWFFRENGFLLEASRGLEGIGEIQRLFKSTTLQLNSTIPALNNITFKIENLENEIKPLKLACHW